MYKPQTTKRMKINVSIQGSMFSDPKVQVKLLVGQLLVQFGSDVLAEAMGRCGSSF